MGWSREHGVQPKPEVMQIRARLAATLEKKRKKTLEAKELTGWALHLKPVALSSISDAG